MKQNKPEYQPDWVSEAYCVEWLGVRRETLFKWRKKLGLAWTNMNADKTVMYDRRQINKILNENSTYHLIGEVKLTA